MNSSEAQERVRVRWAAEETLRRWPAAQAAVLFGSRARGEHRPDSDWDIAIITARSGPRPDGLPLFALDRTDIPVLTAERIRQHANALGAVECEIGRDGTSHRTHDMNRLAQQIEHHLKNREQTSEQGQKYLQHLADHLRMLNGDTRHDHKSDYPAVPVSAAECTRAGQRLVQTLALWADEIKRAKVGQLATGGRVAAVRMRDDLSEAIRKKDGRPSAGEQTAFAAAMKCRTHIAKAVQNFAARLNEPAS